jgi:hypothetical protein
MNVDMDKVAAVLVDAGHTLQKVASERDALSVKLARAEEENAALLKRMEAEKVAADMHDKGVHLDVPFDKLAAALEQEEDGRLEVIKTALQMRPGDMMSGARLSDTPSSGSGGSDLESFILGTVG